jgi:hypothetical protein
MFVDYYIDSNNDVIISSDYINNKFNTSLPSNNFINKYQLFEMIYNYNNLYEIIKQIKEIELELCGKSGSFAIKYNIYHNDDFIILFDDEKKLYNEYLKLIKLNVKIELYNRIKELIDKWGRIDFYIMSYNNKQYNLLKTIKYIYKDKTMIYINETVFKYLQNVIISFSNQYIAIIHFFRYLFNNKIVRNIMSYIYYDYNKFVLSLKEINKLECYSVNIDHITKNIGSSYAYIFSLYIENRLINNEILFYDTETSFFSLRSRKPIGSNKKCNPLRYDYIIIPKRNDQYRIYLLEIQGEHHTFSNNFYFNSFTDTTKKCCCNATISDYINNIKSYLTYDNNAIPLLELFAKDFINHKWINIINDFEDKLFLQSHYDIKIIPKLSSENKKDRINLSKVNIINNIFNKYYPHLCIADNKPFNIDFLP